MSALPVDFAASIEHVRLTLFFDFAGRQHTVTYAPLGTLQAAEMMRLRPAGRMRAMQAADEIPAVIAVDRLPFKLAFAVAPDLALEAGRVAVEHVKTWVAAKLAEHARTVKVARRAKGRQGR